MQIMITDVQMGRGGLGGFVWMPTPGFYDISKVSKLSHFVCFASLFYSVTIQLDNIYALESQMSAV